ERADVAACAGPRHPRRRRNLALLVCHWHVAVGGLPGPVQERALEAHRSIGPEKAVAVRHRPAEPLAIEARQGRYDVLRGMRNERGEMIAADGAVVEQEVQ